MKNKGFTLAEVLITLGIIGVVAAFTMPSLIANYQKQQTITHLKKVYSVLSQAYAQSQVDNGEASGWAEPKDIGIETYFNQYWKPYLKIAKECTSYAACGYGSNSPWYRRDGIASGWTFIYTPGRRAFILADGTLVHITVTDSVGTLQRAINVDLNAGKGPNIFGKDIFQFQTALNSNLILPSGYDASEASIQSSCSKTGYGDYCAAKIMQAGWEIKDDYPW